MGNFLRNARLFAATAMGAALMAATAPAVAADETAGSTGVSARAPTSSLSRHHGPTHVAASRYVRHIRPVQSNLDCTGAWCGRQFVLIVGIGF